MVTVSGWYHPTKIQSRQPRQNPFMTATEFNFDYLADQLAQLGTLTSPAELHGFLCGRLSGGARYAEDDWLVSAFEFLNPANPIESAQRAELVNLYHQALAQLQDHQLGFTPLMPDDDCELTLRLEALGQWCHGYLNGFGTSGIGKNADLSGETAEALRDFAAFVQMDQDCEADQEAERDYLEIVEYVRVAALSVFMEMALSQDNEVPDEDLADTETQAAAESPTLH